MRTMLRANRRTFIATVSGMVVGGLVSGSVTAHNGTESRDDIGYEIWAVDQGTDMVHILSNFDEDDGFEDEKTLELDSAVPHMIDFSSDGEYSFIAHTGGEAVTVVDTENREVVSTWGDGGDVDHHVGTAHFAGITPDDGTVHVDDLHHDEIHVFDADLDNETFEHEETLDVDDMLPDSYPSTSPVCHEYTSNGQYAYVTLGPGFGEAGLFVLDVETNEVHRTYDPDRIRTNCGTLPHPDKPRMYLNGGEIEEGVWYSFNTETHEPRDPPGRDEERDSRGDDPHGLWLTCDNRELWMVNRVTNDGIVINTQDQPEPIIKEIDQIGPAEIEDEPPYDPPYSDRDDAPDKPGDKPDIMVGSPDDEYVFCTLRGLNPQSAGGVAVGENPGVVVLSVDDRERVSNVPGLDNGVWQPENVNPLKSDFHGINVRELD